MSTDHSRLQRKLQEMPADIRGLLIEGELMDTYHARPAYQQNDYLAWIGRAKQPATRMKRINQMLEELEKGGVYMGMFHQPSRK